MFLKINSQYSDLKLYKVKKLMTKYEKKKIVIHMYIITLVYIQIYKNLRYNLPLLFL